MSEVRLIDANKMKDHVAFQKDILVSMGMEEIGNILVNMVIDEINIQPTVDAVPVTRCGQCKHGSKCPLGVVQCKMNGYKHRADWFCADGERRSE